MKLVKLVFPLCALSVAVFPFACRTVGNNNKDNPERKKPRIEIGKRQVRDDLSNWVEPTSQQSKVICEALEASQRADFDFYMHPETFGQADLNRFWAKDGSERKVLTDKINLLNSMSAHNASDDCITLNDYKLAVAFLKVVEGNMSRLDKVAEKKKLPIMKDYTKGAAYKKLLGAACLDFFVDPQSIHVSKDGKFADLASREEWMWILHDSTHHAIGAEFLPHRVPYHMSKVDGHWVVQDSGTPSRDENRRAFSDIVLDQAKLDEFYKLIPAEEQKRFDEYFKGKR